MGRFKEFSKCCKECGVEWDKDMSNKHPKRALCKVCGNIEAARYRKAYHDSLREGTTKLELMQPYKMQNRQQQWREVNKQLKPLKKLEDIHNFIVQQADIVFGDKKLMEYTNKQK